MTVEEESFQKFWLHYLTAHAHSRTRGLHYLGTTLFLIGCVISFVTLDLKFVAAGIILAYLLAWTGHLFIEKNRPRTFVHPVWSFFADIRMFRLWLVGRLDAELQKASAPLK